MDIYNQIRSFFRNKPEVEPLHQILIRFIELKVQNDTSWRMKQSCRLALRWILTKVLLDRSLSGFDEVTIRSRIKEGVIDKAFEDAILLPANFDANNPLHKIFLPQLFEDFNEVWQSNYKKNISLSGLEFYESKKESILPYPIDYLMDAFMTLQKWSIAEPTNLKLRPSEVYYRGQAELIGFRLGE